MPLFQVASGQLRSIGLTNFLAEKDLQRLIEASLETVFNCRLVAREFSTGSLHGGRIDTLALSEDDNPVIIEYKKVESSELITQSLYYLSWIRDHRGDFQVEVNRVLGPTTAIDWDEVRVICIAPGYRKFDLHAAQVIGANIELWQYRLFENETIYLEEVFRRSTLPSTSIADEGSTPRPMSAGQKAALTRRTGVYSVDQHLANVTDAIRGWVADLREYILGLDGAIEEAPKKMYIAYKLAKNFACLATGKTTVVIWVKLEPGQIGTLPANVRDVRTIGHHGTGDVEINIRDGQEVEYAKSLIRLAFERAGGG